MYTVNDVLAMTGDELAAAGIPRADLKRLNAEVRAEARTIYDRATGPLTGDAAERFNLASDHAETLADLIHDADLREIRSAAFGTGGSVQIVDQERTGQQAPKVGGTMGRLVPVTTFPLIGEISLGHAMRTLDEATRTNRMSAEAAEVVERSMTSGPETERTWTQRWATTTGAPAYERAFAKLLRGDKGHLLWTPEEADAYRAAEMVQSERALGSANSAGGYLLPMVLDPAVRLSSGGSTDPMRQVARVVTCIGNAWHGVTSEGVTAEWHAEANEMADASPTFGQPKIDVHAADAFVPFSYEIEQDAANLHQELALLLADAAQQLQATAFTTGTGTGQPKGIITALAAATGSKVNPTTAETITATDLYNLQSALPPRFQPGATWLASLLVLNALRQFETTNGSLKFPTLQDLSPTLLGRPVNENSSMSGIPNAAVTGTSLPIVYGDLAAGYTIVDRLGSTVELVQHLFGANRRPTGQRGLQLWFRTGGDLVIPNAVRALNVATTA